MTAATKSKEFVNEHFSWREGFAQNKLVWFIINLILCWKLYDELGGVGGRGGDHYKFLYSRVEEEMCTKLYSMALPPKKFIKYSVQMSAKKEDGMKLIKMTVRGTMVRSEVYNSWCVCLES